MSNASPAQAAHTLPTGTARVQCHSQQPTHLFHELASDFAFPFSAAPCVRLDSTALNRIPLVADRAAASVHSLASTWRVHVVRPGVAHGVTSLDAAAAASGAALCLTVVAEIAEIAVFVIIVQ